MTRPGIAVNTTCYRCGYCTKPVPLMPKYVVAMSVTPEPPEFRTTISYRCPQCAVETTVSYLTDHDYRPFLLEHGLIDV